MKLNPANKQESTWKETTPDKPCDDYSPAVIAPL